MGIYRLWRQPVETFHTAIYSLLFRYAEQSAQTREIIPTGITSGKYIICYVKEQGLFYFDDRKQDFVPLKNNLPDGIKNFVIDAKDQVFFLTEHGNYYIINYLSIALISNSRSKKKSNNLLSFPAFIFLKIILSLTMTGH